MKKKLKLSLILIVTTFSTYSQIICDTPPPQTTAQQQKTILFPEFLNPSFSICVDVFYHIVRNTNGTGGFDPNSLDIITATLNEAFNPHNFFINGAGFDFINNTGHYEYVNNEEEFDTLVQINNRSDAINIYIVNDAYFDGRADGYTSQALVIIRSSATKQHISHEVGHCFDLYHTFETYFGTEEIVRPPHPDANCTTTGDLICDTPADNGSGLGGGYDPDTDNIMSYYFPVYHFSNGQAQRMREAFASSILLQQTLSDLCRITGSFEICNTETYTVGNSNDLPVIWSVSPNLKILPIPAPTNTSVTVAPKYPSSNGIGYIQAQTSSQSLQKEVWVGSPNSSSSGLSSYNGAPVDTDVYMNSYDVVFAPEISPCAQYEWEIAYNNNPCINDPNAVLPYFTGYNSNHIISSTTDQVSIAWGNCTGTFTILCYATNTCGSRYLGSEMVEVHGYDDPEPCDNLVINVYPNPSSSEIHANIAAPPPCGPIEPTFPPGGIQATIYDMQGNPQYSKNFNSSNITIENMNLSQGNYILNIQTTTGQSGQEIIIVE